MVQRECGSGSDVSMSNRSGIGSGNSSTELARSRRSSCFFAGHIPFSNTTQAKALLISHKAVEAELQMYRRLKTRLLTFSQRTPVVYCVISRGRRLYIFKVFIEYPLNLGSGCISMFSINLTFDKTLILLFFCKCVSSL